MFFLLFFLALTDRSPRRGDVCPSVCETRFGFFNKVKYIEVFKAVRKFNITFFFLGVQFGSKCLLQPGKVKRSFLFL